MENSWHSRWIRASRWTWLAALAVVLGACGGGEQAPAEAEAELPAADTSVAPAEDVPDSAKSEEVQEIARRFLPDEMRRSTRAERFPHGAHVRLVCSNCHQHPQGHTVHVDLKCAQCHRASAQGVMRNLTPADCMACHHSPERNLPCSECHTPPGPLTTQRQIKLSVWPSPRTRSLPFDHARHSGEECSTCHERGPTMAPTRTCASCHESHHRPDANCVGCHQQPPPTAHTLQAHLSCLGSGCHSDRLVDSFAQKRVVCLVCHQAQQDHEPGRECADCHQVRPGEGQRMQDDPEGWPAAGAKGAP
ncbi:MAG: hypothetical protein PVJ02_11655 [Gemmatimonadota bacterium]|jgi:hypothetical protein